MTASIERTVVLSASIALVAFGLAGCAPAPEAPPPAPSTPAKLGYTCADNAINCAYKNRDHRPPAGTLAAVGGGREISRKQGPVPPMDEPHALATVQVGKLRPVVGQRWMLNATVSAAAIRLIDPEFVCDFTNAGLTVATITYAARNMAAGETVEVELTGPLLSATYVDGATCRVTYPLHY